MFKYVKIAILVGVWVKATQNVKDEFDNLRSKK